MSRDELIKIAVQSDTQREIEQGYMQVAQQVVDMIHHLIDQEDYITALQRIDAAVLQQLIWGNESALLKQTIEDKVFVKLKADIERPENLQRRAVAIVKQLERYTQVGILTTPKATALKGLLSSRISREVQAEMQEQLRSLAGKFEHKLASLEQLGLITKTNVERMFAPLAKQNAA